MVETPPGRSGRPGDGTPGHHGLDRRRPDRTWDELEGLPQPLRNAAHRAIFHLLEEPVPALAEPSPEEDPLPGAYRLYLPSDGLTI